jgi:hypothetical protein
LGGAYLVKIQIFFSDNSYSIQSEIEADICKQLPSYDLIYLKLPTASYFSTNSVRFLYKGVN